MIFIWAPRLLRLSQSGDFYELQDAKEPLEEGGELYELRDAGQDLGGPGGDDPPVGAPFLHLQTCYALLQHSLHISKTKPEIIAILCILQSLVLLLKTKQKNRKTDVAYLGWPIAPSYMSPNADGLGGGG